MQLRKEEPLSSLWAAWLCNTNKRNQRADSYSTQTGTQGPEILEEFAFFQILALFCGPRYTFPSASGSQWHSGTVLPSWNMLCCVLGALVLGHYTPASSRLLVSSRGASKGIPLAPVSVSGMAIKRLPLLLLADSKLLLQMRSQHAGEQQQHFPVTERTNMHKHAFPLI